MKKLKLSVLAMFLLSTFSIGNGYANTSENFNVKVEQSSNVKYLYSVDLGDVAELSENVCNEAIVQLSSVLPKDGKDAMCTVKVKVKLGVAEVEVIVTCPCEEVVEKVKEICKQLMDEVGR